MNVGELKKVLEGLDDNMELIMQRDSEGNGYSPLSGAEPEAVYVANNTWSGVVYDTEWSAEDADMGECEWEQLKAGPKCVVLFPIN